MVKDYVIGLDLGINNVGYSVIDKETKEIIKKGVRLYSEASNAEERRVARNTRRRIKRKDNRVQECLKIFETIHFPNKNTIDSDLLKKRIKGLQTKLEKQEIVNICCYFMSHRGYIPFGDEERNLVELNGLYPCEYYQEIKKEYGKYRALEKVVSHEELLKELEAILQKQKEFYPELQKILSNEEKGLIPLFNRKRKFWEGPGSENSFSPYGRFKNENDTVEYQKLKQQGKEKYLFEELIGHCSIYKEEKCVPKANVFAEKFNLLNDFINIRIIHPENIKKENYIENKENEYKLTTEALENITDFCMKFEGKTLSYIKVLKEVLGLKKEDINGFRVDKDGTTPLFSLMKAYRYIMNLFKENNLETKWLVEENYQNYNKLIEILAVAPGIIEIEKMLSSIKKLNAKEIEVIKEIKTKLKNDKMLEYHALGNKALVRAIQDILSTGMNFMQVSKKFDYEKEAREYFLKNYGKGKGRLLMTSKYVEEIIASPQVKKTLRQAIKIINAIIKEQGTYPSIIAIESTKEMNGNEKRKKIEQEQKRNETRRREARKRLEEKYNDNQTTENRIERVKLFLETNEECPYCGKLISMNDVINDILEVEHILPISASADNSQNNKTICCRECNSKKRNRTPYNFLTKEEFELFEKRILKYSISEKKIQNFLTTEDVNKYKIRFFNRNLRDTAYATKELVNQVHLFNNYLKAYTEDIEIKTLSTPGQLTHDIRDKWGLEKDRDDGKYHHAVDASIVGGIAITKLGELIVEMQNDSKFWLNKKEVALTIPDYLKNFYLKEMKESIMTIKSDLDIQISMEVNKDPNRSLSNANICSFIKKADNNYFVIDQIPDIYSPDLIRNNKEKLDKLFDEKNQQYTLLCQEKNPKLFNYLKNIYNMYQHDKENPFLNYCEELLEKDEKFDYLKHGIKTPSKNGKGVLIKKIRYMRNTSEPFLLNKKNIAKKEQTLIGLDSVSIYCTRLFWNQDLHKIIFIPVYCPCVNLKTKIINENHPLYQNYYQKYVAGKNVIFIVDLFNGNYVEIKKSNGEIIYEYIKGYAKANKSIQCKSGKYLSPKDKFTLYDVDILGNKKKRLTWPKDSSIM